MNDTVSLLISSGDGPGECQQAVAHVLDRILAEADSAGLEWSHAPVAGRHGPKSVLVLLSGTGADGLARAWTGTIQWVCKSSLRKGHKRQNWFIGVFRLPTPAKPAQLDPRQVRFDSFRAGGPGGQHQNTTDSAVRATCLRSGLSAVSRDGRSQHRNKALALERLGQLIAAQAELDAAAQSRQQNLLHHQLERGNPVRVFRGPRFQ